METAKREEPGSPVGEAIPRREDARLLRGEGRYVGDVRLPGMLCAGFVRCPHAHARIRRLNLEPARQLPGVIAAFGPRDVPLLHSEIPAVMGIPGSNVRMPSPLVTEARFEGEPVAVVLAEDQYAAADAVEAVEVEYEVLDYLLDATDALDPDAPRVHPDVEGNRAGDIRRGYGNLERAFAEADVVIRERFSTARATAAAIEPRGVVAQPGGENGEVITLWDSTQAPHAVRRIIAQVLDVPQEQVRVIAPDVGGGFGPKGRIYQESVVLAILARHLNRPLCWQATRGEDFLTTYQGRGLAVEAELAAKNDGTLLGLRARLIQDVGAYLPMGLVVPMHSAQHLMGPYRLPAFHAEILGVYTNRVPLSPLRGGGREQGVYVMERLLDHLARRLEIDPVEVRRRNLIPPDAFPFDTLYPTHGGGGTVVYDSGDYPGYLDRAHEAIDYAAFRHEQEEDRKRGRYRGVALTMFLESTGGGPESARVQIGEDGTITITVGSPSTGQSHATVFPQVCAAILDVPMESIRYVSGDTAAMEQGTGTFASRMALTAGNATELAAQEVRSKILAAASEALEAAERDLELVAGSVQVRGVPDRAITLAQVAQHVANRDGGEPLEALHHFSPHPPNAFAGGCHAAVVEVDIETGWVHVERYVVVHDCGTVLNPIVVEGQVHGGVVHGMGTILGEMMCYDRHGAMETNNFHHYVMPLAEWVPPIEVHHHESPSPFNPAGIKGAGEGGTIGALPAIPAAVEDALAPLGLSLNELPLRLEALAEACRPLRERHRQAATGGTEQ